MENKEKMLKIIMNEKYPEICIIKRKFGGSRVSNNIDDPARDHLGKHNNVLEMTAINNVLEMTAINNVLEMTAINNVLEMTAINIAYPYGTFYSCSGEHTWTLLRLF